MKEGIYTKVLAMLNLAGFAGTLVINGLANSIPINGKTTGAISAQYPNLFVPAGYTFSIWGLIYLLLAGFIVFQFSGAFRNDTRRKILILSVGPWFMIASLANMGWILAWHHEMLPLSLILMGIILISLLKIYTLTGTVISSEDLPGIWLARVPFSVYLGWITVATIANVTALLVAYKWSRFGLEEATWAIIMLLIAGFIGLVILFRKGDIFFNLILLWAFTGILVNRISAGDPVQEGIILTIIIWLGIIPCFMVIQWIRKKTCFQMKNE